ncbi:hypothetical protein D083_4387 [Dickeya solani RNS 08.23.3.1.A]|nr:hypothetical protein D083_4387 [Dickeya solani RNS 08.23.3.1.A]
MKIPGQICQPHITGYKNSIKQFLTIAGTTIASWLTSTE